MGSMCPQWHQHLVESCVTLRIPRDDSFFQNCNLNSWEWRACHHNELWPVTPELSWLMDMMFRWLLQVRKVDTNPRSVKMWKCSWIFFIFIFPCDVYLRFSPPCSTCVFESRLSVWKKAKKTNKQTNSAVPIFLFFTRRNIMFSYGHLSVDFQLSADSISLYLVSVMDYANRQLLLKQRIRFFFSFF